MLLLPWDPVYRSGNWEFEARMKLLGWSVGLQRGSLLNEFCQVDIVQCVSRTVARLLFFFFVYHVTGHTVC